MDIQHMEQGALPTLRVVLLWEEDGDLGGAVFDEILTGSAVLTSTTPAPLPGHLFCRR
jgi:hypothetical protein